VYFYTLNNKRLLRPLSPVAGLKEQLHIRELQLRHFCKDREELLHRFYEIRDEGNIVKEELEANKATAANLEWQLKASQANVANLEWQLKASQANVSYLGWQLEARRANGKSDRAVPPCPLLHADKKSLDEAAAITVNAGSFSPSAAFLNSCWS
ncbi:unnamed protein product, partial [Chrysoparadoxa australica]